VVWSKEPPPIDKAATYSNAYATWCEMVRTQSHSVNSRVVF